MVSSADILAAFREVTNVKQIERSELYGLLQDGIMAALAKKYGPTVKAEVEIDDDRGGIKIVLLKTVVETAREDLDAEAVREHVGARIARYKRPGSVEFTRELGNTPWGSREFVVKDCDGRLLAFGA